MGWVTGERQLPDAVGSCEDPVLGHQGPSAGVTPLATGAVLQGDLEGSVGAPVAEGAGSHRGSESPTAGRGYGEPGTRLGCKM